MVPGASMPATTSMLHLPLEILAEIFSYVTRREAVGAKASCRILRDVCRSLESEDPGHKLHHRLRLMVACSSTAEVVEFSFRGQTPPKRVAVGRAWAKSDKVKRFTKSDGPWLTGIALRGDRLYCQCYHEQGTVVLDGKTLKYKRMYLPPQKKWEDVDPGYDGAWHMPDDQWQIQGPEGIACAGDKVYTTFADGKVGCVYLNEEEARVPKSLAVRWIDRFRDNLSTMWSGADPIYAFCQSATALGKGGYSEVYARLGDEYDEIWDQYHPPPAWKQRGPCWCHEHLMGAMHEEHYMNNPPTHDIEAYRYVAWGCDVGPDGALYVAVDREYHLQEGAEGNYTTPPGPCAEPGCSRRKTGVIMRVQFAGAGAGTDAAAPPDAMITQEFYTKGEHLARPSGLTFNSDGDMLVASMDGCVSKFGGPGSARRGEYLGVFHSLRARDELRELMLNDFRKDWPENMVGVLERMKLQPMDVWAPRGQGGKVFISIHRCMDAAAGFARDAPLTGSRFSVLHPEFGVIVCDGAGNEIDFIRDPHIAVHCNMMTGE